MKAVLIGTAAYQPQHQDIDLICDQEFADKLKGCQRQAGSQGINYFIPGEFEATVPNPGTAYDLILNERAYHDYRSQVGTPAGKQEVQVASIPALLALKKAHLILPRKWEHHIAEYRNLKNIMSLSTFRPLSHGNRIHKLFKVHRTECREIAKAHPRLNQSKSDFFEESDFKIFDHDTIHQAIALGDVPAYTLMQDGEVWCSKVKWMGMSEEDKLRCVIEEASVLALERSIIPACFLGKAMQGSKWAYELALQKICTTITSGWFREYAIENYWRAQERRPDFVGSFFKGLRSGLVKVLKPEVVL